MIRRDVSGNPDFDTQSFDVYWNGQLVATYNEGAGLPVLTLVEDSDRPGVTLDSARNGRGSLVMTLDGADVCVRTRHSGTDASNGVRWVSLNRSDEEAAEYLLRNWMEHL